MTDGLAGLGLEACLARITERDPLVRAWAWRTEAPAFSQGGPLAGLVAGIKDVTDVAGMPTTYGSGIFSGQIAQQDARPVAQLRRAGAIILGKTVTAEFATYHPGPTANPLDPTRTPGGSSSGSAAAVGDGQCDFALGTQTAGSVIRPASYCGVIGFKPSRGRYSLAGTLRTSSSLDTLGLLARNVAIAQAVDAVLARQTAQPDPRPVLRIGLLLHDVLSHGSQAMQSAVFDVADRMARLGHTIVEYTMPPAFDRLTYAQALIHKREVFEELGHIRTEHPDEVSVEFRTMVDEGGAVSLADYRAAKRLMKDCRRSSPVLFEQADFLLTAGAPDVAPSGLSATGNPIFQRRWTAAGLPCLGFPAAYTASGLPLGAQLVGPTGADRQLLADAKRIVASLE